MGTMTTSPGHGARAFLPILCLGQRLRVPFFLGKNGVKTRGLVNTLSKNALAGEDGDGF